MATTPRKVITLTYEDNTTKIIEMVPGQTMEECISGVLPLGATLSADISDGGITYTLDLTLVRHTATKYTGWFGAVTHTVTKETVAQVSSTDVDADPDLTMRLQLQLAERAAQTARQELAAKAAQVATIDYETELLRAALNARATENAQLIQEVKTLKASLIVQPVQHAQPVQNATPYPLMMGVAGMATEILNFDKSTLRPVSV